jgi:membrane-associated protease RseP (regulator of RpoE activity)
VAVAVALGACATSPLAAQSRPGWVGVSINVVTTQDASGTRTLVRVADVQPGSPAARAGILPGDLLVEVNDMRGPEALRMIADRLRLNVGDSVRIVVRRSDRDREVRIAAAERPQPFLPPLPRVAMGPDPDSMVASISRAMDSLRVQLAQRREGMRVLVLQRPDEALAPDAPIVRRPELPGAEPAIWVDASGAFSPLNPYILGRNRVAGAEVMDVRPELARYFGVDAGVLVVDVPPGTPAALAGLRPGDVIFELGEVPVGTVDDLRVAVGRTGPSALVRLIRHGVPLQVVLPR